MAGLYIHIPFCASRCIYCGFYSTTLLPLRDKYIEAVCREMQLRRGYLSSVNDKVIHTVYIGGGTPSLLSEKNLARLFKGIHETYGNESQETTIECNPDDVSVDYAGTLSQFANRVSMGAQTFSDDRLSFLHRRHKAADIASAVENLRNAGIKNISIDLMFGFPGETLSDWTDDIRKALSLGVEHISAYSLMYEEKTPLYNLLKSGKVKAVSDDLSLEMYSRLIDMLTAAGYEHYEISNFARHGFHAKHNTSYWQNVPYIGLGAAAHSYNLTSRQWNACDIKKYIDDTLDGKTCFKQETIDDDTHYNDIVTTELRTPKGICLNELKPEYRDYILSNARQFIASGKMKVEQDRLSITRNGIYISDDIMSELMWVD
jgi:oxygen-independent coproporphyrinogen-3 oxidase